MPIYKQKDGTYLVKVNYKDENGKYRQIVRKNSDTKTKAGALKLEARLLVESTNTAESLMQMETKILEKMTFQDLVNDYLDTIKGEKRYSTLRQKKQAFDLYLLPYFGKIKIVDFTPSLIQNWKKTMDSKISTRTGKPFNTVYKNTVFKALCSTLNYAAKFYGYSNTAHRRVGTFKDTFSFAEDKEIHYWTFEQFKAFSDALRAKCEEHDKNLDINRFRYWGEYVFFNILFFCGLRKGEVHALKWTDIKNKGSYYAISVTKSLSQKADYEVTPPKNKSSVREVPICQALLKILDEHYKRYQTVVEFDASNPVWFICGGLMPVTDTTLDKTKNAISKQLGLPKIRIHDLRHSFVSMLINADVNIKTISKLVGHSTVDQTWNTYGHLYPDKENEAIKTIDIITNKLS